MTHRLPPQPTNTRLARFVTRQINRLHSAHRWAANNSPLVRRRTYDALADKHSRLNIAHIDLQSEHRALIRDYGKFLPRASSRVHQARYRYEDVARDPVHITRVDFEPLSIASLDMPPRERAEIAEYTQYILREHANALARSHSEKLADVILSHILPDGLKT